MPQIQCVSRRPPTNPINTYKYTKSFRIEKDLNHKNKYVSLDWNVMRRISCCMHLNRFYFTSTNSSDFHSSFFLHSIPFVVSFTINSLKISTNERGKSIDRYNVTLAIICHIFWIFHTANGWCWTSIAVFKWYYSVVHIADDLKWFFWALIVAFMLYFDCRLHSIDRSISLIEPIYPHSCLPFSYRNRLLIRLSVCVWCDFRNWHTHIAT